QRLRNHAEHRDRVHENRRLRVERGRELILGPFPGDPGQGEPEDFVRLLEHLARRREPLRQVTAHADELRSLTRKEKRYHRTTAEPQVKPAPNATIRMFAPGCIRPASSASSRAMGSVAELMLPYRSTLTNTFSIGMPAYRAVASMIRMFAWCGTRRSMSAPVRPARISAWSAASAIDRTAALNTSLPAIFTKCDRSSRTVASKGMRAPPPGRQSSSASVPSERMKLDTIPRPFVLRRPITAPPPSPKSTHEERSVQSVMALIFSVDTTSATSPRPAASHPSASHSAPSERKKLDTIPRPFVLGRTITAPAPSPKSTHVERSVQSVMALIFSVDTTSGTSPRPAARYPSATDSA